MSKINDTGMKF